MRITNVLATALLACCCVFVLLPGPVGAGHCDKKPDHPHCNGGGEGGGDHPVDLTFRDGGADRIGSDFAVSGTVSYVDGEPGVSARIRDDGILLFNIVEPYRGLSLDFSDLSQDPECGSPCKKNFVSANTVDYPPGAAVAVGVFEIGSAQHRTNQFLGMNVGETLRGEMKIGFGGSKRSTRFSVRFQALGVDPIIDAIIAAKSSFLEITRNTQDTWFIEAVDPSLIGGDEAFLFSKFKQKGTVYQDEGTYHMPFGLTVSCQSGCP